MVQQLTSTQEPRTKIIVQQIDVPLSPDTPPLRLESLESEVVTLTERVIALERSVSKTNVRSTIQFVQIPLSLTVTTVAGILAIVSVFFGPVLMAVPFVGISLFSLYYARTLGTMSDKLE